MHTRLVIIIAAAAVFGGSVVAAQPTSPPPHPAEQPQAQRADIVLASADSISPSSSGQQAQPAPRHPRVARVTTCRCGDQPSAPEE
jgi:hypothetical protein